MHVLAPTRRSLGAILADAQERGLVAQNVVVSSLRRKQHSRRAEGTGKLKVGIDIPGARRNPRDRGPARRALPGTVTDGDLHRAAGLRAARLALG